MLLLCIFLKLQDSSDYFQEDYHPLGSSEESYEPSPISVLDPLFGEDIESSYSGDHACGI